MKKGLKMKKSYKQYITDLCVIEGGKEQISVAQVREAVGAVAELIATDPHFLSELLRVGLKRLDKKTKK